MAVFSCLKCGYAYEFLVSNSFTRRLLTRTDHCPKCDRLSTFRFMSVSGMVGRMPFKPVDTPGPSHATLYWRKQRGGKTASQPLNEVCKKNEF
ncbi:hypothetical protein IOCL2690_000324800 [Leishmania lindenbergi]|uniref:Regulatory protein FmdB Zinc ribbon domain-containing protein n=1 Tax=Leishmania lindenbergi TaxID=651832 RepID=A0AAW3AJ22_9TRYP